MGRFDGKVVIVTGAARGQGAVEARRFAEEGATVVLGDVLDDDGEALATELGGPHAYVHLDVSREADWAAAIEAAQGRGPLRVLVNNAGIIRPAAIEDTSLDDYLSVIHVNQVGCFLGMRMCVGPIRDHGGGAIVNISSIDGMRGSNGLISYAASKWAVRGMTKVAAMEFGRFGVRVNSVHPGGVNTIMGNPAQMKELETVPYRFQPIARIGESSEIAEAVLFLASDAASYITGTELVVDGGTTTGRLEPGLPGGGIESGYGYNAGRPGTAEPGAAVSPPR
jgi:3alpha(or 20beta)-hydroxysteroid dehydrogenase